MNISQWQMCTNTYTGTKYIQTCYRIFNTWIIFTVIRNREIPIQFITPVTSMETALHKSKVTRSWCCFCTTGSIVAAHNPETTNTRINKSKTETKPVRPGIGPKVRNGKSGTLPACFFSVEVPLRSRISRSTRPRDMRPRVRPDMIPANRTRKHDNPAYTKNHTDPNAMLSPSESDSRFRASIRVAITAFNRFIALASSLCSSSSFFFSFRVCNRQFVWIIER